MDQFGSHLAFLSSPEMTYIVSGGALNSTHSLTLRYPLVISTAWTSNYSSGHLSV